MGAGGGEKKLSPARLYTCSVGTETRATTVDSRPKHEPALATDKVALGKKTAPVSTADSQGTNSMRELSRGSRLRPPEALINWTLASHLRERENKLERHCGIGSSSHQRPSKVCSDRQRANP